MSNFPTQYDKRASVYCETGDKICSVYSSDENGKPILAGSKDLNAEIQSHRESVELSVLLQRYEAGDFTALNKVQGTFADVSNIPSSFGAAFNQVKQAEEDFRKFPEEFRKLFGDNPVEFYSSIGSKDFDAKITKYRDSRKHASEGGSDSDNN